MSICWSKNDDVDLSDNDTIDDHGDGANDGVDIGDDAYDDDDDDDDDDVQGLMPKELVMILSSINQQHSINASMHHQCIINASSMHHRSIINTSWMLHLMLLSWS